MANIVRGATNNWTFIGTVGLVFHTDTELDDERWRDYIKELEGSGVTHLLGGAWGAASLTSVQRGQLSKALSGVPAAVVVNHAVARGILTAVSWLGLKVKPFTWIDVEGAVKFLKLPPELTQEVVVGYKKLVRESLPAGHPGLAKLD